MIAQLLIFDTEYDPDCGVNGIKVMGNLLKSLNTTTVLLLFVFYSSLGLGQTSLLNFDHITSEDGLSQNSINAIAKDKFGFMWFGTESGLCRYDGYRFRVYRNQDGNPKSIDDNKIYNIVCDAAGDIWVQTFKSEALFRYNYNTDDFERIRRSAVSPALAKKLIPSNRESNTAVYTYKNTRWSLDTRNHRLVQTDISTGQSFTYSNSTPSRTGLNESSVSRIYLDNQNILWVGTYSDGINKADLNAKPFHHTYHDPTNPKSIPDDNIGAFTEDNDGNLWVGSKYNGLIKILRDKKGKQTPVVCENIRGLTNSMIRSLFCDAKGYVWIGTKGGLSRYNPLTKHIDNFSLHGPGDAFVYWLTEDNAERIWIATWQGVYCYDYNAGKLFCADSTSFANNRLKTVLVDDQQNLWVGSQGEGIKVFKIENNGKLKLAFSLRHKSLDSTSLSDDAVTFMYQDAEKNIWVGTNDGLNKIDHSKKITKQFYAATNSIANSSIAAITEDDNGYIWISNKRGISRINKKTFSVKNYSAADGLQSNEFSDGAVLKSHFSKILYFGGSNGYNSFVPDSISSENSIPQVVFTELQILNKPVSVNQDVNGRILLEKPLYLNSDIELNYKDKSIAIEFAGLHYSNPAGNKYAYMLAGFDKDWIYTDASKRVASYSNLAPGNYVFKVRAANSDGVWNPIPKTLSIHVLPPFWASPWAYALYFIVTCVVLIILYRYSTKIARLKSEMRYEAILHEQNKQFNEQKIEFFTNVSHEIKTPLSLILAPIERLMALTAENASVRNEMLVLQRNGSRLLKLVSQMLDMRKFETGNQDLNLKRINISGFLTRIASSFELAARQRHIDFICSYPDTGFSWVFDDDKIETVLINLLSNAFKFTPNEGKVELSVWVKQVENVKLLMIEVKDNGVGIPASEFDQIFKPFQQGTNKATGGTGLGLAYSRSLVELHGGTINVSSNGNTQGEKQTCFSIGLPVIGKIIVDSSIPDIEVETVSEATLSLQEDKKQLCEEPKLLIDGRLPVLLLVEDNQEMRHYLRDFFTGQYQVIEAANGAEGLELAASRHPDLILSDVMMPEMDGLEFCRRLKNDILIAHIPVLLLTARSPYECQLEGLETGADDYIVKPFNLTLLSLKMKNLIRNRLKLRDEFRKRLTTHTNTSIPISPDDIMLKSLIDYIETRIDDPELHADEVCTQVGLSRTNLYRKLKTLTGMSITEFIKDLRLTRGAQLLKNKKFNVNEVASMTGFTDAHYFRKCFKQRFGVSPLEYIRTFVEDNSELMNS